MEKMPDFCPPVGFSLINFSILRHYVIGYGKSNKKIPKIRLNPNLRLKEQGLRCSAIITACIALSRPILR
jgi:hypothetical protein